MNERIERIRLTKIWDLFILIAQYVLLVQEGLFDEALLKIIFEVGNDWNDSQESTRIVDWNRDAFSEIKPKMDEQALTQRMIFLSQLEIAEHFSAN